ncbi:class I SAM-dependent methyltransferase [Flavobacterium sp. WC2430]|uniref:class I SAM-dependent methyltransferase n=1 Tax=Flavobacterium sp. WC2430 TaxID=3234137 RepID=UPI0034663CA2
MIKTDVLEELFCQRLEINALSEILCYKGCERWIYGFMLEQVEEEHLRRYKFAVEIVKDKVVLDVASGCGYGSYLLAVEGNAKKVFGLDISEEAVRYSNYRYKHENISRVVGDATEYKFTEKYDVITSFETVEHIADYEKYLSNIEQVLLKKGILIISTPIVNITTTKPYNPHHVIEWNYIDFHKLISKYFIVNEVYFQDIVLFSDLKKQSFFDKILKKLKIKNFKSRNKIPFEKCEKQYDLADIKSGFQMFVCEKKQNR